jgi:iron complex outermembrane receptor protein
VKVLRSELGGSSLSANDPLYVIDGVPASGGIEGGKNPLTTINQNNIESITVMASATAIYGLVLLMV